jgi:hypothetical protein
MTHGCVRAAQMGQWEHKVMSQRHETPLVLQMCRLLRGFTAPGCYFSGQQEGMDGDGLALYSVTAFAEEIEALKGLTVKTGLLEKLSMALQVGGWVEGVTMLHASLR